MNVYELREILQSIMPELFVEICNITIEIISKESIRGFDNELYKLKELKKQNQDREEDKNQTLDILDHLISLFELKME